MDRLLTVQAQATDRGVWSHVDTVTQTGILGNMSKLLIHPVWYNNWFRIKMIYKENIG